MSQHTWRWLWKWVVLATCSAALAGCDEGSGPVAVLATAVVTGPAPLEVAFDLSYSDHPQHRPMTFELTFGDESPPETGSEFDVIIHHTYEAGTYAAVLRVMDEQGAASEDLVRITADDAGPPIGILLGQTAPEFTAHTTDGGSFTLSSLRGSVVVLDFWGAWCPPCRATLPHLDSLATTYACRGLSVVIVSTDVKEAEAVSYLEQLELEHFTSVWERGGKSGNWVAQLYGVADNNVGIPRTYVIDRQGVIRFVGHPSELTREMVEAIL